MRIDIQHRCDDFTTYRAARVKSLFNAESGAYFNHTADLDIDDDQWNIGVVVGPSGSGKTSIGRSLWGGDAFYTPEGWRDDAPIVDCIAPDGSFDAVTGALGQVGLGDVPAWLRPYRVLSNGEQFRADLAKILAETPNRIVIDEFTSVIDRQIAKVGAGAFAKGWRRTPGQAVLLTCHYDVLDWLEPDWVYDTLTGDFTRGSVQYRRPRIDVEIRHGGWGLWPLFEPHHYLKAGPMPASSAYVAFVDGKPVAHLGMGTRGTNTRAGIALEGRACRMVVLPEWQGAGIGMRFLNAVCQLQMDGHGVKPNRMTTQFHTSHPQLCAALRRDPRWRQMSAALYGGNKKRSAQSIGKSKTHTNASGNFNAVSPIGYGGHFRAVQGFRYIGKKETNTP